MGGRAGTKARWDRLRALLVSTLQVPAHRDSRHEGRARSDSRSDSARRRRNRLMPDQFAIRQGLTLEHDEQGVAEQERIAAPIEAELDFVDVARQVLDADLVERADDGAVQQA